MKNSYLFIFIFFGAISYAQTINNFEKYPVFSKCETTEITEPPICFRSNVQETFSSLFTMPEIVNKDNYLLKI